MLEIACATCQRRGWHDLHAGPLTEAIIHPVVDAAGCTCCPVAHDHTGLGCRPVVITVLPGTIQLEGAL
jgi:hypothetical protein